VTVLLLDVALETGTYVDGVVFGVALSMVALLFGVVLITPVLIIRSILSG